MGQSFPFHQAVRKTGKGTSSEVWRPWSYIRVTGTGDRRFTHLKKPLNDPVKVGGRGRSLVCLQRVTVQLSPFFLQVAHPELQV